MKKGFTPTKVTPEIQAVMDEEEGRSPIVAKLLIEQRKNDKKPLNPGVEKRALEIRQEIGCPEYEARYRARVEAGEITEVPYEPEPFKFTEEQIATRAEFLKRHRA